MIDNPKTVANGHLFTGSDGALYDTRLTDWTARPLRKKFKLHLAYIATANDFKATLRAGPYAWPGGYPIYFICDDGAALCFGCARKEIREILSALHAKSYNGWHVAGCDVNYDSKNLDCEHCYKPIPSAY